MHQPEKIPVGRYQEDPEFGRREKEEELATWGH